MPLSERPVHIAHFKAGNWDKYSQYLSRTSCLIPFPPSLYEPLPQIIKSTLFLEFPIYRFEPESGGDPGEKDKNVGDKNESVGDKNERHVYLLSIIVKVFNRALRWSALYGS
ncbi:13229_t:CDS:2 [Cetraspora pellucida]|uniref:13229_t:CDS:1 n=1 Tax=Cetraspora pellucida TaxID=1433469 RepID=A0A9N8WS94_9GLOM|nr:13229_t:CDS:2 [Cetraspora pellucida]